MVSRTGSSLSWVKVSCCLFLINYFWRTALAFKLSSNSWEFVTEVMIQRCGSLWSHAHVGFSNYGFDLSCWTSTCKLCLFLQKKFVTGFLFCHLLYEIIIIKKTFTFCAQLHIFKAYTSVLMILECISATPLTAWDPTMHRCAMFTLLHPSSSIRDIVLSLSMSFGKRAAILCSNKTDTDMVSNSYSVSQMCSGNTRH